MATFEIIMPKLGESIIEATITKWLKSPGDMIAEDDALVEIATDKVDSEIPSPVEGKLLKRLFEEGDVVAVGTPIAIISLDGSEEVPAEGAVIEQAVVDAVPFVSESVADETTEEATEGRYYSPLVKSIAKEEGISLKELDSIAGSGKEGRVTKEDVFFLKTEEMYCQLFR